MNAAWLEADRNGADAAHPPLIRRLQLAESLVCCRAPDPGLLVAVGIAPARACAVAAAGTGRLACPGCGRAGWWAGAGGVWLWPADGTYGSRLRPPLRAAERVSTALDDRRAHPMPEPLAEHQLNDALRAASGGTPPCGCPCACGGGTDRPRGAGRAAGLPAARRTRVRTTCVRSRRSSRRWPNRPPSLRRRSADRA